MKKTGIVCQLNVSPKGHYEGFLLECDGVTIQINIPKEYGPLPETVREGTAIAAEVEAGEIWGEPAHEVFSLVRIQKIDGEKMGRSQKLDGSFSSRVVRLNYALHGEVNGGILESGDFLHLKPEGAREVGLEAGMAVSGRGLRKPMTGGHSVIEADEVNGIAIHRGK